MARRVYLSERGFPLAYHGAPGARPVLTAEVYCKWYTLHLVHPDGRVEAVDFPGTKTHAYFPDRRLVEADRSISGFCDHVPNPRAVNMMAAACGWYIDSQAYEMIVGRWAIEVADQYDPEGSDQDTEVEGDTGAEDEDDPDTEVEGDQDIEDEDDSVADLSYHDVVVFVDAKRYEMSTCGFGLRLTCCRVAGWQLWEHGPGPGREVLLGGEFDSAAFRIEVAGRVIAGNRADRGAPAEDAAAGGWAGRVSNPGGPQP